MELLAETGTSILAGAGTRAHAAPTPAVSRKALWTGRVLSGLSILFLAFDAGGKLLELAPVVEGTRSLGYPTSTVVPLGIVMLASFVVYAVPRTSVLGAILLTGYLGGAIATHVRVLNPLFSHILFPIYVAILIWGGLCLRSARVRSLLFGGAPADRA